MEIMPSELLNQTAFCVIGKIVNLNDYQKLRTYCNNLQFDNQILIADLTRLSFSSTHGLGMFVTIAKTVLKIGKHFVIFNPRGEILHTMQLIGIDKVVTVCCDIQSLEGFVASKITDQAELLSIS